MIIGVEASRANKLHRTGVEWYAWHVIQELKKRVQDDQYSWLLYAHEPLQNGLEFLPENWHERRLGWPFKYGWTQMALSWELFRRSPDVLFLPCSTLPRWTPKNTVVTVHDVGFARYPQLYKKRQVSIHRVAMREVARRAAIMLTVSEFSRREMIELYDVDPSKIIVTPLGIDHTVYRPIADLQAIQDRLQKYHLSKPFFVYIGRLEAKKNLVTLVKAFTEWKRNMGTGDPHTLVLVGIPGFGYEEIQKTIAASPVSQEIIQLGYVPENDIPFILNAAEALIQPSWYEGFGLPPIQAMACGCPVISSNAGSLAEIVGDAGLLFSPFDMSALCRVMMRLVTETDLREDLRRQGVIRATAYTWQQTATQTFKVLANVAQNR